jgi:2-C-methyl-D-erythritol 4-phosphate cytidylyltransferase
MAGKPMLITSLQPFHSLGLLNQAIIVVTATEQAQFEDVLNPAFPDASFQFVHGGAERQDSVRNGLEALLPTTEIVLIHDAARPFVDAETVQASIDAAREYGAATVAVPSVDTILEVDDQAILQSTPPRERMWACQTPQSFRIELIRSAHEYAVRNDLKVTDDATLVCEMGHSVKMVLGTASNFKVTEPMDLRLAELILQEKLL